MCAVQVCVNVLLFVCGTAVPCRSPAEFPPELSENDGALPTGTPLHHCDLITSTLIQSHSNKNIHVQLYTVQHRQICADLHTNEFWKRRADARMFPYMISEASMNTATTVNTPPLAPE